MSREPVTANAFVATKDAAKLAGFLGGEAKIVIADAKLRTVKS